MEADILEENKLLENRLTARQKYLIQTTLKQITQDDPLLTKLKSIETEHRLITKIKNTLNYLDNTSNSNDALKLYQIFNNLKKVDNAINLEQKLLQFYDFKNNKIDKIKDRYSIQSIIIPDVDVTGYNKELEKITLDKDNKTRTERRVYMDAPLGIILKYDKNPVAITTFSVTNNNLKIYQIQGITEKVVSTSSYATIKKLRTKGLFELDWKKMLVTINEDIAKYFNLNNCCIQSAKNNHYTKINYFGDIILNPTIAEKIYDSTAESLGYIKSKDDSNWYKQL